MAHVRVNGMEICEEISEQAQAWVSKDCDEENTHAQDCGGQHAQVQGQGQGDDEQEQDGPQVQELILS